jgi:4-hydroxybenzoate polyprenyltransferase
MEALLVLAGFLLVFGYGIGRAPTPWLLPWLLPLFWGALYYAGWQAAPGDPPSGESQTALIAFVGKVLFGASALGVAAGQLRRVDRILQRRRRR